jgi:hypothetical protein
MTEPERPAVHWPRDESWAQVAEPSEGRGVGRPVAAEDRKVTGTGGSG